MTNKMPVVGQRYRIKTRGLWWHKESEVCGVYQDRVWIHKCCGNNEDIVSLESFYKQHEELPSNLQKTEDKISPKSSVKVNENPLPVDPEKGEINKVERALEDLKIAICEAEKVGCTYSWYYWYFLAKDLVNALEAQKNKRAVMSKPEPKIDMKEERVEPVSIWKDVSELPKDHLEKHGEELIGLKVIFGGKANFATHVDIIRHGKGMTLTDFINSFEQMQKDIEELINKLNKQGEANDK